MKLGKLGVWASLDTLSSEDAAGFVQRVEAWGYDAHWMPEAMGRNALVFSSWLLGKTTRLKIATGIANIYGRDAIAMASAQKGLAEQSGNRFLLGLGVSHLPLVEGFRGHDYGKPVASMRAYIEAMRKAAFYAVQPSEKPPLILAALGPKMLELARDHADGAHPYNVTPEHTAEARRILGPGKWLCVEQMVLLEKDPAAARAAARKILHVYMGLENYLNNWRRLGFGDDDFAGGGSNRLLDAMVVWGGEKAIRHRIQQHWDAGADHVCIQPVTPEGKQGIDENVLKLLAPKS